MPASARSEYASPYRRMYALRLHVCGSERRETITYEIWVDFALKDWYTRPARNERVE